MSNAQPRPQTILRLACTMLACASAAWAIGAGSALAPEPADLTDPLIGGTGATAGAIITIKPQTTTVLLWPAYFVSGGNSIAAGTPCSTFGIAPGTRTTKRIQENLSGTQRRCVDYDPLSAPLSNWPRPLPPEKTATEGKIDRAHVDGANVKIQPAVTVLATGIAEVILWPSDWTSWDPEAEEPIPQPIIGQPCSDFEMFAGETTYKHIQVNYDQNGNDYSKYRCVSIDEPPIIPVP